MAIARYRAKQKGLPYALDENAIQGAIDAGVCELTRIPFDLEHGKTWNSPSLDRIDSSKGYTPDNVRVVLYCLNVMANIWGENKIIEIADAIMAVRRSRSSELQDRLESALKRRLSTQNSQEYELTWKDLATKSGRPYCQLAVSVRRTSGSDSSGVLSGWTTPQASEPDSPERPSRVATGRTTEYLGRQVNQLTGWPSPVTEEHRNTRANGNTKAGETLDHAAKLAGWPSPTSKDEAGRDYTYAQGNHARPTLMLPGAAKLAGWRPSPQSHDTHERGNTMADHHHYPHDLSNSAMDFKTSSKSKPVGPQPHDTEKWAGLDCPSQKLDHIGRQAGASTAETDATGGSRLNPGFSLWLIAGDSVTPALIETCPRGLVPFGRQGTGS
jgi:hypothetical protein